MYKFLTIVKRILGKCQGLQALQPEEAASREEKQAATLAPFIAFSRRLFSAGLEQQARPGGCLAASRAAGVTTNEITEGGVCDE